MPDPMRDKRLPDESFAASLFQNYAADLHSFLLKRTGSRENADDAAERLNLRHQLDKALAALPENQRKVLLACKRDGMSYEEASRATGISLHMVPKYLVQAK